jgi:hypothetical protein
MKEEQFYLCKWMITCKNVKISDYLNEPLQHYIEIDDAGPLCGINILLEEKAKFYYNKITSEEHKLFNNYPIYQ